MEALQLKRLGTIMEPDMSNPMEAGGVLNPAAARGKDGVIADVVFPTGIDQRTDIGMPDRYDVYYGMADNRIGVARLDLSESLEWL